MNTTERTPNYERIDEIIPRVQGRMEKRTEKPEFPFGVPSLDAITGGIRRGKLSVIAGRTSEGKTSLAMQQASHLVSIGKTVAFISLEDDRETLVEKLYCQAFQVDNWRLQRGEMELFDAGRFAEHFRDLRLLVLDEFGYNIEEIKAVLMDIKPKPEVVFIDYVQLTEVKQGQNEFDVISNFVKVAQRFCKHEDIAMVLLSQINRQGARDGRPSLHTLARCGRLEECAELVLLMYAPWVYEDSTWDYESPGADVNLKNPPRNYLEVEIAKNKQGRRAVVVPVKYTGAWYWFEDWTKLDTHKAKYPNE